MKYSTLVLALVVCVSLLLFLSVSPVQAEKLGDIGENIAGELGGLAKMFELGGYFVGVVFIVLSLITFANARQEGTGLGVPLMFFVAGVLLLSMGAWISTGSETVFGTNEASKALDALESGGSALGD